MDTHPRATPPPDDRAADGSRAAPPANSPPASPPGASPGGPPSPGASPPRASPGESSSPPSQALHGPPSNGPSSGAPTQQEEARHRVAALLGRSPHDVSPLGAGTDHIAFVVGDDLVARLAHAPPDEAAPAVEREAAVLRAVAGRLPVATPVVVSVHAEAGLLVTTRIAGAPLLGRPPPSLAAIDLLGDVVSAIHAIPPDVLGDAVEPDDFPLAAFAAEAEAHLAAVSDQLDPSTVDALAARLASVPAEAPATAFVHNDLGAEHLFTTADGALTGVIDWADAALADPARDLARVLRDLGPDAHRRVVARYAPRYAPGWDDAAEARTWFLARCAALEDLAYGVTTGEEAYADAALRSLTWLAASPGGAGR